MTKAVDTENFKVSEFACKCRYHGCRHNWVDQRLIDALQLLRDLVGAPIYINSGCRCARHNEAVGGTKNSTHLRGIAADVRCGELSPAELARFANQITAFREGGIGVYGSWLHLDVRGKRARWGRGDW